MGSSYSDGGFGGSSTISAACILIHRMSRSVYLFQCKEFDINYHSVTCKFSKVGVMEG